MKIENCEVRQRYCSRNETCYLIVLMRSQAQTGGYTDLGLTEPCGPYWSFAIWKDFVNRNIDQKLECGSTDEMIAACEEITAEKTARNELIYP